MPQMEKKSISSRFSFVIGAAVLAGGIFTMWAAGESNKVSDAVALNRPVDNGQFVETMTAKAAVGRYVIKAPGRLQSRQNLRVVGEVAGKVTYVNPKFVLGGRFEKGETFFQINQADYKAEVARSKAAMASAEASFVRARLDNERRINLVKTGAVSEAARDQAVANLAAAKAGVEQAKSSLIRAEENLARTTVKAPFAALVTSENISQDSYVAPGQELARIIDTRVGELIAGLSPKKAEAVTKALAALSGTKLTAVAKPNDGSVGSGELRGFVDQFSPSIDAASRTALVIAVFPDAFSVENSGLVFANDFMTLEIEVMTDQKVWQVPVGAVRKDEYVWIVQDDKMVKRAITVINYVGETALITSNDGLDGEQIILSILSEEHEGLKVRTAASSTILQSR